MLAYRHRDIEAGIDEAIKISEVFRNTSKATTHIILPHNVKEDFCRYFHEQTYQVRVSGALLVQICVAPEQELVTS